MSVAAEWWPLAATTLRVVIASFFLLMSWKNLSGDPALAADFARWGYPSGFRVFTGVLQVAGALLLIPPSTCLAGAAILLCVLAGAVATHALHDPLVTLASPLGFVVLVCVASEPAWRPLTGQ